MVIPVGRQVRLYGSLALYKKVKTARDDYMQTRLNAGFFFTHGTKGRFHWLSRCCALKLLGDAHAQDAVKQVSAGVAPCNMVSFVKLFWTSVARQLSRKVELPSISATAKSFTVHHHLVWSRSVLLRYANQKPEQQISKLSFLIYVWVPEVGNTADTPNPPWVLPL